MLQLAIRTVQSEDQYQITSDDEGDSNDPSSLFACQIPLGWVLSFRFSALLDKLLSGNSWSANSCTKTAMVGLLCISIRNADMSKHHGFGAGSGAPWFAS